MTTRLVVHKDGWLYRLAYGRRPEEKRPTGTVNLCDTVWLAIGSLLRLFGIGLFFVCLACLAILCGVIIVGFVWVIVIPAILDALAWLDNPNLSSISADTMHELKFWVAFVACYAAVVGLSFGVGAFVKSETWRLFRAYLRAKKEKVCPIVEVV